MEKNPTFIAFAVIVILDGRFWTSTELTGVQYLLPGDTKNPMEQE